MIKVFIPTIIIAVVLIGSIYACYRCYHATAWWRWFGLFPLLLLYIIVYGFTIGYYQLNVREVTYESKDVPLAFDGYKIAQISDLHCGSGFCGPYRALLRQAVDKVNSLKPDMICCVGDLQTLVPQEAIDCQEELSSLKAPDGVYSIMGNHDYVSYSNFSPSEQRRQIQLTRDTQRSFGWSLLDNENRYVYRESKTADGTVKRDSILIVGEENWGLPPFPQRGNLKKALRGTPLSPDTAYRSSGAVPFTVLLSHDPNAWRHHVLPIFRPNIMLAGHTHGTQFSFLGWTPASMAYKEWGHEYYDNNGEDSRKPTGKDPETLLSVSTGFGGNLPFRFGMPREIVLITLKHKRK